MLQIAFLTLRPIRMISSCSCKIHFDTSLAATLQQEGVWSPAKLQNWTDTILFKLGKNMTVVDLG